MNNVLDKVKIPTALTFAVITGLIIGAVWGSVQAALATVLASDQPATTATTTESVAKAWIVKEFVQSDGRKILARVPTCTPAASEECVVYVAQPRPLLVFLHGSGAPEDATSATKSLNYFGKFQANTIFAYGVSASGTKKWDAGACCTTRAVDDVGYLVRSVGQIDAEVGVNLNRVGLFGSSNGGMMSHKGACERPDVFKAGASFAGTYTGQCGSTGVKIAQWHGGADPVVPVNGGSVVFEGRTITFPPATAIGTRMATGTLFSLVVIPGFGHTANATIYSWQINWMTGQFVG